MSSSNIVRWSGLAALLGGVLGIVLTPILTYLWATYSDLYGYFGRAYFFVFLGCLLGVAGLYAGEENLIIGMTLVGLATALVGSILDYWGGSGEGFTWVQVQGFGMEI